MKYKSTLKIEKNHIKAIIDIPFDNREKAVEAFRKLFDMLGENDDDTLQTLNRFVGNDGIAKGESNVL